MKLILLYLLRFLWGCEASITTKLFSKNGVLPYKLEKLAFALTDGPKFQVLKRFVESDLVFNDFESQIYKISKKIKASIPFLQMYDQLYTDTIVAAMSDYKHCQIWAAVGEKQICDLQELDQLLNSKTISSGNVGSLIFSFDISNPPKCNQDTPVIILYGDPSDSVFVNFFRLLLAKSDAGEICFVFRFKLDSYKRGRFALSGYGVELAVKSTEYKVVDDRVISNSFIFNFRV